MGGNSTPSEIKQKVLELSFNAFIQKGFKNVSMDEVARELKISKKTIYKYYDSKEELLELGIKGQFGKLKKDLKSRLKSERSIKSFVAIALAYREVQLTFPASLMKEIHVRFPHLMEIIALFEQETFEKNFIKTAKQLRNDNQIEYLIPTRQFSNCFFAMLRGMRELPREHYILMVKFFIQGIYRNKQTDKKRKK